MTEPTTESGRRLLASFNTYTPRAINTSYANAILAIEAEAGRADALRAAEAAPLDVERLALEICANRPPLVDGEERTWMHVDDACRAWASRVARAYAEDGS